jgi:hypothetical protein
VNTTAFESTTFRDDAATPGITAHRGCCSSVATYVFLPSSAASYVLDTVTGFMSWALRRAMMSLCGARSLADSYMAAREGSSRARAAALRMTSAVDANGGSPRMRNGQSASGSSGKWCVSHGDSRFPWAICASMIAASCRFGSTACIHLSCAARFASESTSARARSRATVRISVFARERTVLLSRRCSQRSVIFAAVTPSGSPRSANGHAVVAGFAGAGGGRGGGAGSISSARVRSASSSTRAMLARESRSRCARASLHSGDVSAIAFARSFADVRIPVRLLHSMFAKCDAFRSSMYFVRICFCVAHSGSPRIENGHRASEASRESGVLSGCSFRCIAWFFFYHQGKKTCLGHV